MNGPHRQGLKLNCARAIPLTPQLARTAGESDAVRLPRHIGCNKTGRSVGNVPYRGGKWQDARNSATILVAAGCMH